MISPHKNMDSGLFPEPSVAVDDVDTTRSEPGSSKVDDADFAISSDVELNGDLGNISEALTSIELDLACASEKLCNLNILMMNVATKEGELEAFDSVEEGEKLRQLVENSMQFDFLSGFLRSEVRELDCLLNSLETEIRDTRHWIPVDANPGRYFTEMEEKLSDSATILVQLQEQVTELRDQSDRLQKTPTGLHGEQFGEVAKNTGLFSDGELANTKNKIHTAEQLRNFLRMLEKSLARELDLEKKLSDCGLVEEELKIRLQSAEQEVFCLEEDLVESVERGFETDNSAEVFLGISKELLGRLQLVQFNLNGYAQREADLRLKLDNSAEQFKLKDNDRLRLEQSLKESQKEVEDKLATANSEISILKDTVSSLQRQIEESESAGNGSEQSNKIEDLKQKLSKSEAQCKLLSENNLKLEEELGFLKASGVTPENISFLEKRLRESDIQLQNAVASAEASEEKQKMLYSSIKDMENIIEDLKLKASKFENLADSAENKCIVLSETNAELSEEVSFLRSRFEFLESSLTQAETAKMRNAKDIRIQADMMANLVLQLAVERERLHNQISSLTMDKKILVVKLHQYNKDGGTISGKISLPDPRPFTTAAFGDLKEQVTTECSVTSNKDEGNLEKESMVDQAPEDSVSHLETSRRIDAGALSIKHILLAALIILIAAAAASQLYRE